MDKYEFKLSLNEINALINERRFDEAAGIADGIDWNHVKSTTTLCRVSEVYKIVGDYDRSRDVMAIAYQRDPENSQIIYSLCDLTIYLYQRDGAQSDLTKALQLLREYQAAEPDNPRRLILQYKVYCASPVSNDEKIAVLEQLHEEKATARWDYELAKLYADSGNTEDARKLAGETATRYTGKYADKAQDLLADLGTSDIEEQQQETNPEEPADHSVVESGGEAAERITEEAAEEAAAETQQPGQQESQAEPEDAGGARGSGTAAAGEEASDLQEGVQAEDETAYISDIQKRPEENGAAPAADETAGMDASIPFGTGEKAAGAAVSGVTESTDTVGTAEKSEISDQPLPGATGHIPTPEEQHSVDSIENAVADGMKDILARPYDDKIEQETSGQYTMVVDEPKKEDTQVDGQMSISEVMAEWEKIRNDIRKANDEKRAQRILEDTGSLMQDFDETARHGLLEDIEKGVARQRRQVRSGAYRVSDALQEDRYTGRPSGNARRPYSDRDRRSVRADYPEEDGRYAQERRPARDDRYYREDQDAEYAETDDRGQDGRYERGRRSARADQYRQDPGEERRRQRDHRGDVNRYQDVESRDAEGPEEYEENPGPDHTRYAGPRRTADRIPGQERERFDSESDVRVRKENAGEPEEDRFDAENAVPADRKDSAEQDVNQYSADSAVPVTNEDDDVKVYGRNDGIEAVETRRWNSEEVHRAMAQQEELARRQDEENARARREDHSRRRSATQAEQEEAGNYPDEQQNPDETAAPAGGMDDHEAAVTSSHDEEPADKSYDDAQQTQPYAEEVPEDEAYDEDQPEAESYDEDQPQGEPYDEEPEEQYDEDRLEEEDERVSAGPESGEENEEQPRGDEEHPGEEEPLEDEEHPEEEGQEEQPDEEQPEQEKAAGPQPEPETAPAENKESGGRRALTREERRLFGPFCRMKENTDQLLDALDKISLASSTGNLIILGNEATADRVAKGVLEIQRHSDSNFTGKIAKVSGDSLNKLDAAGFSKTFAKLENGALIINRASDIAPKTMERLYKELEGRDHGIILIMADGNKRMDQFRKENASYLGSFTAVINIRPLDDKALLAYAKDYAYSQDYSIDEFGQLALAQRISSMQTSSHRVTLKEVRDLVDEAIHYASRKSPHTLMEVISRKRYDENDRIIIHEKDFQHD